MNRICIYTKDIQVITGKSERHSRKILNTVKQINNKEKHQAVTIHELCEYLGLEIEKTAPLIK